MRKERYTNILQTIAGIIKNTQWENHVYAVGGCVRDELMGNDIKDIDMCIDLPGGGIRFAQWLYNQHLTKGKPVVYPTYGTAMFRLKQFPRHELECVQTRKEKYTDIRSRNPETAFGSLEEDCMRRDLTINSLYRNISTGELLDLTGNGLDDIKGHLIRTTATPDIIFDDDPLRILRCIRFATRFGWPIDGDTCQGMKKNAFRLEIITHERIRDEWDKMLTCAYPVQAMQWLQEIGAMHYVVPELVPVCQQGLVDKEGCSLWNETLKVMEKMESDSLVMRMAAVLRALGSRETPYSCPSADLLATIMVRLRYSTETIRQVQFLVTHLGMTDNWKEDLSLMEPADLRRLQYCCQTEERFSRLMLLTDAVNQVRTGEGYMPRQVRNILQRTELMKEEGTAMFGYKLPVTGHDVMEILHITPGPLVRSCLDRLMEMAFIQPVRSKEEWLALLC